MTHRESVRIITEFMGKMAYRYKANDMRSLWRAMDDMRNRYGDLFVASAIEKDRHGAELALLRWEKDEPRIEISPRFRRAYPRQKSIAKRLIALLIVLVMVLIVGVTMVRNIETINHSNEFLQEVDRFLNERRDTNGIVY